MSWDNKRRGNQQGYYYASVREGDQVRKVYLGKGEKAQEKALQVEARRQQEQAQREALSLDHAKVAGAERALLDLQTLVNEMVHAAFKRAGFHKHRGEYRRK